MDEDFSTREDFERLTFWSEITEEKYKEQKLRHHGKMTIPYINVPASGEFNKDKIVFDQLKRMLFSDWSHEERTTVLSRSLSKLGASSYLECLRSPGARLTLDDEGSIFDEIVNVTLRWRSIPGHTGNISQGPILTQGEVVNRHPMEISHDGSIIFQVRRDPKLRCTLSLTIDEMPAAITLPSRPTHHLEVTHLVLPPRSERAVWAHSDSGNGWEWDYQPREFRPEEGSEFLIDSWSLTDVIIHGGDMGSKMEILEASEKLITIRAVANSDVKNRGGYAEGRLSVRAISLVPNN
ncbi:hypothetical protein ACMFL9_26465 [Sinorhizobium meliloti]